MSIDWATSAGISEQLDEADGFGPNEWLVDEMYERWRVDPSSVDASWRAVFEEREASTQQGSRGSYVDVAVKETSNAPQADVSAPVAPPAQAAPVAQPLSATAQVPTDGVFPSGSLSQAGLVGEPMARGDALLATNMAQSLSVPTATSVRQVPAKLLEVNREILNNQLQRTGGGKISFTHLIGWAVVKALAEMPEMRVTYQEGPQGKPYVVRHEHVGLGLAIDLERRDGSRTLLVPCVKDADTLGFAGFVAAYEEMVAKVRSGKVGPDDFAGTVATITNPGMLGTEHSIPRLMPGQAVIVGVGSLSYPSSFEAADPRVIASLGMSKALTLTSTYDHRVIQGATSGRFLTRVHDLLLGADNFYDEIFSALHIPYEPARWHVDSRSLDQPEADAIKQVHVQNLINLYRVRGHLMAHLDPLNLQPVKLHPELDPLTYGLTIWDLDREFFVDGLAGKQRMKLGEILHVLRDAYCRTMTVEYMHIQDPVQKRWIQEHVEGVSDTLDVDSQRHLLDRLGAAEAFEQFLHTRYIGQKRFGLEGAESLIAMLDTILDTAGKEGILEAVIGMAHRGRLNVMVNILGKSYGEIFREFEGDLDPNTVQGSGDVKYHKGFSGVFKGPSDIPVAVSLTANPSHLEAVDPVAEGVVRAKQDQLPREHLFDVLAILIHGDAAFAGQGVVAETLNLSGLRGYRVGGTVHLVVNNQVGFTTAPEAGRSSVYATDGAKMVQAPIFHVNGDDPEACVRAAKLAFEFRQTFHKDVVVDMVCYRRHGHNEGDDPSYTQPVMYKVIDATPSVRKLYSDTLVRRGDLTEEEAEHAVNQFVARLQDALDETRASAPPKPEHLMVHRPPEVTAPPIETGVSRTVLDRLTDALHKVPDGFHRHPKLERTFNQREELYKKDGLVDWSLGETLAYATLLVEGQDVRLTGQDTRRGTFSHRHAVLMDYETGEEYIPLASLAHWGIEGVSQGALREGMEKDGAGGLFSASSAPAGAGGRGPNGLGRFFTYDSLLSEYAALGFEYGYSIEAVGALVIWEAQFGDFANGGQIVIDNFIVAAEEKWGQHSGLVLYLPHGYEGQGPEHSSARIERFLTLSANSNMTLANPTTSAQMFHLLRAQAKRMPRRPLVVFTPKSLLRARTSRSPIEDFEHGHFCEVLDDPEPPENVARVILCSGKVAMDAFAFRSELTKAGDGRSAAAVVRVEQIYPWPESQISSVLARYPQAREVVWLQEEPENMGAWTFVHERLHRVFRDHARLAHVARAPSGSPATGSALLHQLEQKDLLERAFSPLPTL